MRLTVRSWTKTLKQLGYRILWKHAGSRPKKRQPAPDQEFMFQALEPRQLLATVEVGVDLLQVDEGQNLSYVAYFNDPTLSGSYSVAVDAGDGRAPYVIDTVSIVPDQSGGATLQLEDTLRYAEEGSFDVSLELSDAEGVVASLGDVVTVNDTSPMVLASDLQLEKNQPFDGRVSTFVDWNETTDISEYTAQIDWGDGVVTTATLEATPEGLIDIHGQHTYAIQGIVDVRVKLYQNGSLQHQLVDPVTVWSAVPKQGTTGVAIGSEVLATFEFQHVSEVPSQPLYENAWGEKFGATRVTPIISGPYWLGSISNSQGSFVYRQQRTSNHFPGFSGIWLVNGNVNGVGTFSTSMTNGQEKTITVGGSQVKIKFEPTIKVSRLEETIVDYTDPIPEQVLSDFTATIDWGDGTISPATLEQVGELASDNLNQARIVPPANHVYAIAGDYVVSVTISGPNDLLDDAGNHNYGMTLVAQSQVNVTLPNLKWGLTTSGSVAMEGSGATYSLTLAPTVPGAAVAAGETASVTLSVVDVETDSNDYASLTDAISSAVSDYNSSAGTVAGDPNSLAVDVSSGVPVLTFHGDGLTTLVIPFTLSVHAGDADNEADEAYQIVLSQAVGSSQVDIQLGSAASSTIVIPGESTNSSSRIEVSARALSTDGETPYEIQFAATNPLSDTVVAWAVAWGDGSINYYSADATSAQHVYHAVGDYSIRVHAEFADGSTAITVPSLDHLFGTSGKLIKEFAGSADRIEQTLALPDGKLLISAVTTDDDGQEVYSLLRYNTDGSIDTTFNNGDPVSGLSWNEVFANPEMRFQATFEDVLLPAGNLPGEPAGDGSFGLFTQASGFEATVNWGGFTSPDFRVHNQLAGPAFEGQQYIEVVNWRGGVQTSVDLGTTQSHELTLAYAPRPGITGFQNAIEVWWDGQLVTILSEDGSGHSQAQWQEIVIPLPAATGSNAQLEFRSHFGIGDGAVAGFQVDRGGLIDHVRLHALDADPANPQLLLEANFEDVSVSSNSSGQFPASSGFSPETSHARMGILRNFWHVGAAAEGQQHLALDGLNTVQTTLELGQTREHVLKFAYAPRQGISAQQAAVEIWWDGQLIHTESASSLHQSYGEALEWREVEVALPATTTRSAKLELKSNFMGSDPNASTYGYGAQIDNLRVSANQFAHELVPGSKKMAVQSDGSIIIAGATETMSGTRFGLFRLTAAGVLDGSFGTNGFQLLDQLVFAADTAWQMQVMSNDRVVIGIGKAAGLGASETVVRLNADGSVDSSFDSEFSVVSGDNWWSTTTTRSDQTVVQAGMRELSNPGDFAIVLRQFTSTGSQSSSFGIDGVAQIATTVGQDFQPLSLSVLDDNSTLLIGRNGLSGDGRFVHIDAGGQLISDRAVANLDPLDLAHLTSSSTDFILRHATVQGNQKIVLVSEFVDHSAGTSKVIASRYLLDGTRDQQFGEAGILFVELPGSNASEVTTAITVDQEGSIFIAGYEGPSTGDHDVSLIKLLPQNYVSRTGSEWSLLQLGADTVNEGEAALYTLSLTRSIADGQLQQGDAVSVRVVLTEITTTSADHELLVDALTTAVTAYNATAGVVAGEPGSFVLDTLSNEGPLLTFHGDGIHAVNLPFSIATAANDGIYDPGESYRILLAIVPEAPGIQTTLGFDSIVETTIYEEALPEATIARIASGTDIEGSQFTFTVSLSQPSTLDAMVKLIPDFDLTNGINYEITTTDSGYDPVSGTIAFSPSESVKTFTLVFLENNLLEGAKDYHLSIQPFSNAVTGENDSLSGSITDNDVGAWSIEQSTSVVVEGNEAEYELSLDGSQGQSTVLGRGETATVTLSAEEFGTSDTDYESLADAIIEGASAYNQSFANNPGDLNSFAVDASASAIVITYYGNGIERPTLPVVVSIYAEDEINEPDEAFKISLGQPGSTSDAEITTGPSDSVTTIIVDESTGYPEIEFEIAQPSVNDTLEGSSFTLNVRLSRAFGADVIAQLVTVPGFDAEEGIDYTITTTDPSYDPLTGILTFATGGILYKSFTVTLLQDTTVESLEAYQFELIPVQNASLGTNATFSGTILDQLQLTDAEYVKKHSFDGVVATLNNWGGANELSEYSVSIDWGDGNHTAGSLDLNAAGVVEVTGQHTYRIQGERQLKVTVSHNGAVVHQVNDGVMVWSASRLNEKKLTAVGDELLATFEYQHINAVPAQPIYENQWVEKFSKNRSLPQSVHTSWVGTVSNNDGSLTYSRSKLPGESRFLGFIGTWHVTGNVNGVGSIDENMTNGQEKIVNINGSDVKIVFAQTIEVSRLEPVLVDFTDPISGQSWNDFSAVIDWGDGTTSQANLQPVNTPVSEGINEVRVLTDSSHTYAEAGDYIAQVTISGPPNALDDQGNHNYGQTLVTNTRVEVIIPSPRWNLSQGGSLVQEGNGASYTLSLTNEELPSAVPDVGEVATIQIALVDNTTNNADRQALSTALQNAAIAYNLQAGTTATSPDSVTVTTVSEDVVEIAFYGDGTTALHLPFVIEAFSDLEFELDEDFSIELSDPGGTAFPQAEPGGVANVTTTINNIDPGIVELEMPAPLAAQTIEGDHFDINVRLTEAVLQDVVVKLVLSIDGGTADYTIATTDGGYDPLTQTITFLPSEVVKTFTIAFSEDALVEGIELFEVTLEGIENAVIGVNNTLNNSLADLNTAAWSITQLTNSVLESDEVAYEVTLVDPGAAGAVLQSGKTAQVILTLVDLETTSSEHELLSDAMADAVATYNLAAGTLPGDANSLVVDSSSGVNSVLTFYGDGTTALNLPFSLKTFSDVELEPDERYEIQLSDPAGTASPQIHLGINSSVTTTVSDLIPAVVEIETILPAVPDTTEGNSFDFRVRLTEASNRAVTVRLETLLDGVAGINSDYTVTTADSGYDPNSRLIIFLPSETEKTFTVSFNHDQFVEGIESYDVHLEAVENAVVGTSNSLSGNIVDTDIIEWSISQLTSSVIEGDNVAYALTLVSPAGPANVLQSGETAQIALYLNNIETSPSEHEVLGEALADAVTAYNAAAGTEAGDPNSLNVDSSSGYQSVLTFYGDGTTALYLPFSLATFSDVSPEPDERFAIFLTTPAGTAAPQVGLKSSSNIITTVSNYQPPVVTFVITSPPSNIREEGNSFALNVVTESADEEIVVDLVTSLEAIHGVDYLISSNNSGFDATSLRLTFAPGTTEIELSVELLEDSEGESVEKYQIDLVPVENASVDANGSFIGTIELVEPSVSGDLTGNPINHAALADFEIDFYEFQPTTGSYTATIEIVSGGGTLSRQLEVFDHSSAASVVVTSNTIDGEPLLYPNFGSEWSITVSLFESGSLRDSFTTTIDAFEPVVVGLQQQQQFEVGTRPELDVTFFDAESSNSYKAYLTLTDLPYLDATATVQYEISTEVVLQPDGSVRIVASTHDAGEVPPYLARNIGGHRAHIDLYDGDHLIGSTKEHVVYVVENQSLPQPLFWVASKPSIGDGSGAYALEFVTRNLGPEEDNVAQWYVDWGDGTKGRYPGHWQQAEHNYDSVYDSNPNFVPTPRVWAVVGDPAEIFDPRLNEGVAKPLPGDDSEFTYVTHDGTYGMQGVLTAIYQPNEIGEQLFIFDRSEITPLVGGQVESILRTETGPTYVIGHNSGAYYVARLSEVPGTDPNELVTVVDWQHNISLTAGNGSGLKMVVSNDDDSVFILGQDATAQGTLRFLEIRVGTVFPLSNSFIAAPEGMHFKGDYQIANSIDDPISRLSVAVSLFDPDTGEQDIMWYLHNPFVISTSSAAQNYEERLDFGGFESTPAIVRGPDGQVAVAAQTNIDGKEFWGIRRFDQQKNVMLVKRETAGGIDLRYSEDGSLFVYVDHASHKLLPTNSIEFTGTFDELLGALEPKPVAILAGVANLDWDFYDGTSIVGVGDSENPSDLSSSFSVGTFQASVTNDGKLAFSVTDVADVPLTPIYFQLNNGFVGSVEVIGLEPLGDNDSDGLSNLEEVTVHQTNPIYYDTDGDLMGDGFEVNAENQNPNVRMNGNHGSGDFDTIRTSQNPYRDSDGDGLTDLEEFEYNTDPDVADTNGDGVSDFNDVARLEIEDEGNTSLTLAVGDDSGSDSERYNLKVGHKLLAAPGPPGSDAIGTFEFRKGHSYTATVDHRESRLPVPDYDYFAHIGVGGSDPGYIVIDDRQDLVSAVHYFDTENREESKSARVYIPFANLTMDGLDSKYEETVGGYVALGAGPDSKKTVYVEPLFANGSAGSSAFSVLGGRSVLQFDSQILKITLRRVNQPDLVIESGHVFDPFSRHQLDVERIANGQDTLQLSYTADANLSEGFSTRGISATDKILLRGTTPEIDIDIDSNNELGLQTPSNDVAVDAVEEEAPGKFIVVNNSDIDGDGITDLDDRKIEGVNIFTPIVLRMTEVVDIANVEVEFQYNRVDPSGPIVHRQEVLNDRTRVRIWNRPSNVERGESEVEDGGNFVSSGKSRASDLGFIQQVDGSWEVVLYVEGASAGWTDSHIGGIIIVSLFENSARKSQDAVKFTTVGVDVEIDNQYEQHEENSGAIVWRNSDFSKKLWHVDDRGATPNEPDLRRYVPDWQAQDEGQGDLLDPEYVTDFSKGSVKINARMIEFYDVQFDFDDRLIDVWTFDSWLGTEPVSSSGRKISPGEDNRLTPVAGVTTFHFWVEGINNSTEFSADSIKVTAVPRTNDALARATDQTNFTVVETNMAVDGNRDAVISFDNSHDRQLLFWYNNDRETRVGIIEKEDVTGNNPIDFADGLITQKRDLEDFAYLKLQIDDKLKQHAIDTANIESFSQGGELRVTYQIFLEGEGGSMINLYRAAATQPTAHVSEKNNADNQINEHSYGNAIATRIQSERTQLVIHEPVFQWGVDSYLFEAMGTYEGNQLPASTQKLIFETIVEYGNGRTTKKTHEIKLELHDFRDFYDRYSISYEEAGIRQRVDFADYQDANRIHSSVIHGKPFFHQEENAVLVHGWNMPEAPNNDWKRASAETGFKRLYWQGFAGRFIEFDWPTFHTNEGPRGSDVPGLEVLAQWNLTYNASEYQAYRSGRALKNVLAQLDGKTHLLAHSMGNVVAAEALRQWSQQNEGPLVDSYVAMEAAISAGVYGDLSKDAYKVQYNYESYDLISGVLGFSVAPSGNDLNRYWWQGFAGSGIHQPYMAGTQSAATNWINLFNPDDFATSLSWKLNNLHKRFTNVEHPITDVLPGPDFVRNWLGGATLPPVEIWPRRYKVEALDIGGTQVGNAYFRAPFTSADDFNNSAWDDITSALAHASANDISRAVAYEIIAFLSEANAAPVGTKKVPWFSVNGNIQTLGLLAGSANWGGEAAALDANDWANHSFQYNHDATATWRFWDFVKEKTGFYSTQDAGQGALQQNAGTSNLLVGTSAFSAEPVQPTAAFEAQAFASPSLSSLLVANEEEDDDDDAVSASSFPTILANSESSGLGAVSPDGTATDDEEIDNFQFVLFELTGEQEGVELPVWDGDEFEIDMDTF